MKEWYDLSIAFLRQLDIEETNTFFVGKKVGKVGKRACLLKKS